MRLRGLRDLRVCTRCRRVELHPRFRDIVTRARGLGRRVIDRCNLTIATLPNYASLPAFLAEHQVEVIASLPSYAGTQTDRQRGAGVFEQSIDALRRFNTLGYGREGSGLVLHLVTNPVGAFLPASQVTLARDWKRDRTRPLASWESPSLLGSH